LAQNSGFRGGAVVSLGHRDRINLETSPLLEVALQWLSQRHGRDWSVVSASVDVVSVVPQTEPIRGNAVETVGYLVTLTYFYRNPELQTGDYSRMFDNENDARAWAASIKGRTVMIRVDPGDPSQSVLQKEDLQTVTSAVQ
jgi:hypothetical protein